MFAKIHATIELLMIILILCPARDNDHSRSLNSSNPRITFSHRHLVLPSHHHLEANRTIHQRGKPPADHIRRLEVPTILSQAQAQEQVHSCNMRRIIQQAQPELMVSWRTRLVSLRLRYLRILLLVIIVSILLHHHKHRKVNHQPRMVSLLASRVSLVITANNKIPTRNRTSLLRLLVHRHSHLQVLPQVLQGISLLTAQIHTKFTLLTVKDLQSCLLRQPQVHLTNIIATLKLGRNKPAVSTTMDTSRIEDMATMTALRISVGSKVSEACVVGSTNTRMKAGDLAKSCRPSATKCQTSSAADLANIWEALINLAARTMHLEVQ